MKDIIAAITGEWAIKDDKRDAGLRIPEDITALRGLSYGPEQIHTMDIFLPKAEAPLPLIISVHGGGYVYGDRERYRFYCADLCSRGFAVCSFNYRLAPEHIFPAPLEDMALLMSRLDGELEKYGIARENIFMLGDSAGAQLASQYAAICSSGEYSRIMGIAPSPLKLKALGLNCGMYELRSHLGDLSGPNAVMPAYFTHEPQRFGRMLDVTDFIDGAYPPVYLLSSPGDFLLEQYRLMERLLEERGVDFAARIYGDETTDHDFHVDIRSPLARQAMDDELEFFRSFMK